MAAIHRQTILVIEDDEGVAQLERMQLERAGYDVVTAYTAAQAMEALSRHTFALILLDYRLPGDIDGLVFLAQMKKAGIDVPVILVTGFSNESLAIQALRAGVRDLITKSTEYLDFLPEAVERVLRQVQIEGRLVESEAQLTSIIDSNKDAIIISESTHRISLFNKAAEHMFGCPAGQAMGQPVAKFIMRNVCEPAGTRGLPTAAVEESLTSLLHDGNIGVRADGTEFPVELSLSRVQVGARLFHTVIVRDITRRLKNEQALRESDRFARSTLDGLSAHIAIVDETGVILAVNESWKAFAEASPSLLTNVCEGTNYLEACEHVRKNGDSGSEEGPKVAAGIRAVLKGQIPQFVAEYPCHGPDEHRWFVVRVTPFPGEGPCRVVVAHEDITARKVAENALRIREEQLRTVTDNATIAIFMGDGANACTFMNPAAEALTGYSFAEAKGRNLHDLLHHSHPDGTPRPANGCPIGNAVQNLTRLVRHEDVFFKKDGSHFPVLCNASPIAQGGALSGAIIEVQDLSEQRKAERDLRESHEFNRQIIGSLREGLAVLDENFRYRLWNSFMVSLSGLSSEQVMGKHPWDVFRFFTEEECRENLSRVLAGETIDVPDLFSDPAPPGKAAWVSQTLAPLRDVGGRVIGVLIAVNDITSRKKAEEELQRTSVLLHTVVNETVDAVFAKDLEGRYLMFNPAASRFVGRPVEEVLGRDDSELFDPESARRVLERDRRVIELGQSEILEETLTAAGTARIYHAFKAPFRDAQGRIAGLVGISRDITLQKKAEELLSSERTLLRTLIDAIPDIVFTKDTECRFVIANRAAMDFIGVSHEVEVAGKMAQDFFPPQLAAASDQDIREALAGRPILNREEKRVDAAGKPRTYITSKIPVRDASGVCNGVVVISRDVTLQKSLEEQLHQSQKMEAFGQLAGGVAHDFNNLLTIILGYSEMIMGHLPPGDKTRNMIADIHNAGERAAGLTRQLLAFSRKLVLEPAVLDLNDIVTNIEKMLRRLIGEDVVLSCIARPTSLIRVDAGQIEQVIMNLAVNARDAMPRGGRLTIETADVQWTATDWERQPECPPGRYVALTVADTGEGMTPEVLSRIFEPFFTTKEIGKGTGLGLATVFGIVKQSDGFVFVESEVGRGTTFRVLFPAIAEVVNAAATISSALPRGGRETILVVEDDVNVRSIARMGLEQNGYRVLEADGGANALAAFENAGGEIDLLLTDVVMPHMSGREVADALCRKKPGLRVLFVSGYTDDAILRHGIVASERAFLQKPFSPIGLAKKVREVLDDVSSARR